MVQAAGTSAKKRPQSVSVCDGNTGEQTTAYYDEPPDVVVQLADGTRLSLAEFQANEAECMARSDAFEAGYAAPINLDSPAPLILPRPADE